jgi:hypothetical protein
MTRDSESNPLASVGNSCNGWGDHWHISAVTARYANRLKAGKPSRGKIRRIWRTSFYIDECGTLWTVALRWPIFKQKKGSATISLQ